MIIFCYLTLYLVGMNKACTYKDMIDHRIAGFEPITSAIPGSNPVEAWIFFSGFNYVVWITLMINHVFMSFSAVQKCDLSYIQRLVGFSPTSKFNSIFNIYCTLCTSCLLCLWFSIHNQYSTYLSKGAFDCSLYYVNLWPCWLRVVRWWVMFDHL